MLDGADGMSKALLSTIATATQVMPLAKGLFDGVADVAHPSAADAKANGGGPSIEA